jgi:hypothetical protein
MAKQFTTGQAMATNQTEEDTEHDAVCHHNCKMYRSDSEMQRRKVNLPYPVSSPKVKKMSFTCSHNANRTEPQQNEATSHKTPLEHGLGLPAGQTLNTATKAGRYLNFFRELNTPDEPNFRILCVKEINGEPHVVIRNSAPLNTHEIKQDAVFLNTTAWEALCQEQTLDFVDCAMIESNKQRGMYSSLSPAYIRRNLETMCDSFNGVNSTYEHCLAGTNWLGVRMTRQQQLFIVLSEQNSSIMPDRIYTTSAIYLKPAAWEKLVACMADVTLFLNNRKLESDSTQCGNLNYLTSRKGRVHLVFDGFRYLKESERNAKSIWRCVEYTSQKRCRGRCQSKDDSAWLTADHNHSPTNNEDQAVTNPPKHMSTAATQTEDFSDDDEEASMLYITVCNDESSTDEESRDEEFSMFEN